MNFEQALQLALSAVVSALVFVCKLLWKRSEKCETDRYELREEIEVLREQTGHSKGRIEGFEQCPEKACPFRFNRPVKNPQTQ
jgi:hypothetical protein